MRLELTACKEVIRHKFNIDDGFNNSRSRLSNHILVLSDELLDLWERDARDNQYHLQFQHWYFSLIGTAKKLKKVTLKDHGMEEREEGHIVSDTARHSKDKAVVGHVEKSISKHYKDLCFISESILKKEKAHTISIGDIKDVWDGAVLEHFFDIAETPIRIEVKMGDDAEILADYLSLFYRDSKHITIKDTYMHKNEHNLKNYVMKYIPRNTAITFRAFWNYKIKQELIDKFTNYMGYPSSVVTENKKLSHHSYIESDTYIIDLGYRLRVFGDKEDGKTEEEIIMISKKECPERIE